MMTPAIEQTPVFHYKTRFLLNALMDGAHKSKRQGPGSEFYRTAAFLSDPNPSRVDLTRSLMDPFETLFVKTFRQRSELEVVTLADGSHSMLTGDKADFMLAALDCISRSVYEGGDKCHPYLLTENILSLPSQPDWQTALDKATLAPRQTASAFRQLNYEIPTQRCLIFILSDFHWPTEWLQSLLSELSAHYVVPVIIWSAAEIADYPLWRFVQVQDAESGSQHLLFTTPRQQQHLRRALTERKKLLTQLFSAYGCRPIWLAEPFSAQQFDRYFLGE